MISRITCLKSRMMCTNAVQCTCSDYVSNILENKTTFLFVFIECKQNFAHYHPCCLLSPIEDEWHFVRKWTQSHVLLIETTFCCWIRRFSKLSIFEFVHNVFTTSHFIETRELKNIIVRKRLQNINQFTQNMGISESEYPL